MADYRSMYTKLFNEITDATSLMEEAVKKLKLAQESTEEMYLNSDETVMELLPKD